MYILRVRMMETDGCDCRDIPIVVSETVKAIEHAKDKCNRYLKECEVEKERQIKENGYGAWDFSLFPKPPYNTLNIQEYIDNEIAIDDGYYVEIPEEIETETERDRHVDSRNEAGRNQDL